MPDFDSEDDRRDDGGQDRPSKSALKREMTARQALGERLCALTPRELEQIPIDSTDLRSAILESRGISANSARRRHMQYIGKLMRGIDPAPLQAALDQLYASRGAESDALHELEKRRDDILQRGDPAIEATLQQWPEADRQLLRQLVRQQRKEAAEGKPPSARRRLFRYLRELCGSPDTGAG